MLDGALIVDAQFNIFGRPRVPDYTAPAGSSYQVSGVFSPNGNKAYVLSYRASDIGSSTPASVYVFDTSTPVGDQTLPVLGYFELNDYPSCLNDSTTCDFSPPTSIGLDGTTLFLAGSQQLVVAPIPSSFR
jgi:hypothetical protein